MIDLPVFVPPHNAKSLVTAVTAVTPVSRPINIKGLPEKAETIHEKQNGHGGHSQSVIGHNGHGLVTDKKPKAPAVKGLEADVTSVTSVTSKKEDTCTSIEVGVKGSHFTLAMIQEGLERWKQPFCEYDFADIEAGRWSKEEIRKYLYWWSCHNAGRYQTLKVQDEARKAEVKPLPENYASKLHRQGLEILMGDTLFINKLILWTERSDIESVIGQYAKVWRVAMDKEPVCYKKQNAGRREANIWLRGALGCVARES